MSYRAKYLIITAFIVVCGCALVGVAAVFMRMGAPTADTRKVSEARVEPSKEAAAVPANEPGKAETTEAMETAEVVMVSEKTNENTNIVYEYFYPKENKTEQAAQKAPIALQNLTREQLIARIEGFSVISFSPSEVILRKTVKPENKTYILGVWDGRVAVFYGAGDENGTLREVTETPVSTLPEYERERLERGIIVESDVELMRVLEDYGS